LLMWQSWKLSKSLDVNIAVARYIEQSQAVEEATVKREVVAVVAIFWTNSLEVGDVVPMPTLP